MSRFDRLMPALPNFTLIDVIDILLVAVLVYEALMVVRGTRAGHILIGILTMVSIYAIAVGLGLEALRSVLSFIVPYLGLAILVLFQSRNPAHAGAASGEEFSQWSRTRIPRSPKR